MIDNMTDYIARICNTEVIEKIMIKLKISREFILFTYHRQEIE